MNPQTHILLVEDEPALAATFEFAIQEFGQGDFAVTVAETLAAAAAQAGAQGCDAILLDLNLPDSRGLETFTAVHALAPETPVVILSGLGDEALAVESVRAGAQDYLVKGQISPPLVVRAVRYAIERHRIERQLAEHAEQLRLRNEAMEAELEIGRQLQRACLPRRRLRFPAADAPGQEALRITYGFQPAEALGGDFFDILPVSPTQAAVLICDVMGHGVPAALVSAIVRGLTEELAPLAHDPGEFLGELNRALCSVLRNLPDPVFVTAFCLLADVGKGEACYANASHPEPLHLDSDRHIATPLSCTQPARKAPLGLFPDRTYPVSRRPLAEGDAVLLFTDGVSEAGEDSHLHRLADFSGGFETSPGALVADFVADVNALSGRHALADDVCVVGVEVLHLRKGASA